MTASPIRILHVADSAGWAGGETYIRTLAAELDRDRFALGVVVPEHGPLVDRLRAQGVPVHLARVADRLLNPAALRALVDVFRRERPALVQSHGARSNVYTKVAARLARVPVVVCTVHNSLFDYDVSGWRRRAYVLAERLTSPLADAIVAVSGAIAADLTRRYRIRGSRIVVVHNGIDADAFVPRRARPSVLAELALEEGDRIIGLAGRMTPQKGHEFLLEAVARLRPRLPRVRCVLAGDGPLRAELESRAAALGIAACCRFLGARTDVADVLSAVEVVTLPSRSEGLPFALLEAMTLGKPVVASTVGGNPEVVEDGRTGLLVPPADAAALADAIARLLEHPHEAAAMGERGRVRVRDHFTLTRTTRAIEDLYLDLLGARALASPTAVTSEVR
ncbi:MAG TPA: glycosyltransferase family 4 protein [Methylomirabilota bacterium]|jgi:glycosyltransferase involved in cell wall biosynthesis